jgi:ribulose-phosphate 3-epimerase
MTTLVIPAIIPRNFRHLEEDVAKVKDTVNLVQVDICDGIFVKNRSWPYHGDNGEFAKILNEEMGLPFWEDVDYEFHLVMNEPEKSIEEWIRIGASSIVVQIETVTDMDSIIHLCKSAEVAIGISLKASTPIDAVKDYVEDIDFVQCMGSDDLGHHHAVFDNSVLGKIKELRGLYPDLPIAIDIGVSRETAGDLVSAGVTRLVTGGAIFDSTNIVDTINFFQNI